MEKENGVYMTPIDIIAGGDSLQMLKAMIPYLKKESQMGMALMVKFMELKNLIHFFKDSGDMKAQSDSGETPSFFEILTEIAPFLPPAQREMVQSTAPMLEMVKLFSAMDQGGSDPGALFKNMLSPEQESLFATYQSMFSQEGNEEGGSQNGHIMDEQPGSQEH